MRLLMKWLLVFGFLLPGHGIYAATVGPVEHTELPAPGSIVTTVGNTLGALTIGGGLTMNTNTLSALVTSVGSNLTLSSGALSLTGANVTGALGYTPVNKAGDTLTGLLTVTTSATVSAAGTTQGTATALTSQMNILTTVAANAGVQVLSIGPVVWIVNRGANTASVYPPASAQFEAYGVNAAVGVVPGGIAGFVCPSSTQCYAI